MYIFAPLGDPNKRTRLVKFIDCYKAKSLGVIYYGWARELDERFVDVVGVDMKHILSGGGYGRGARKFYILWVLKVFWTALYIPNKSVIHALGWESAFPLMLASIIKRHKIIFDDADRFSLIFQLPSVLKTFLQYLEKLTSCSVALHVVPSLSRYEWENDKMLVLRNTPTQKDILAVLEDKEARGSRNGLTVYINGWVGHTRGAPIFFQVFKRLAEEDKNINVIFAGRVDSAEGLALLNLPNVENHGALNQQEALKLYGRSDVVLTYYDPNVEINRKAESNKWGDCVFFQTPFVVNSEVETAGEFVARGCAWAVSYGDVTGLYELLLNLERQPASVSNASAAFAELDAKYISFDSQVDLMLARIGI